MRTAAKVLTRTTRTRSVPTTATRVLITTIANRALRTLPKTRSRAASTLRSTKQPPTTRRLRRLPRKTSHPTTTVSHRQLSAPTMTASMRTRTMSSAFSTSLATKITLTTTKVSAIFELRRTMAPTREPVSENKRACSTQNMHFSKSQRSAIVECERNTRHSRRRFVRDRSTWRSGWRNERASLGIQRQSTM